MQWMVQYEYSPNKWERWHLTSPQDINNAMHHMRHLSEVYKTTRFRLASKCGTYVLPMELV